MAVNTKAIRLVVAESNPLTSRLLAEALNKQRGLLVVASAPHADALERAVQRFKPDVALLSMSVPGETVDGERPWETAMGRMRSCPWILLLDRSEPGPVVDALRAGARGVFCRAQSDVAMLAKCVRRVAEGQIWLDNQQVLYLLRALAGGDGRRRCEAPRLTAREQSVVHLVVRGFGNREIAHELSLSEHTIKNYLFRIFDKLGVSNRVELALYAVAKLKAQELSA